jgi:phosphatidylglycerophosphate synthase
MTSNTTEAGILTLANIMTSLRLVFTPLMLYFAWIGDSTLFISFFALSLVLGFTDGLVARRLNQVTELGGKLDSWGDLATVITVALCAWWLWPELVRQEAPLVIALLVGYTVPVILAFLKYGRLTSFH